SGRSDSGAGSVGPAGFCAHAGGPASTAVTLTIANIHCPFTACSSLLRKGSGLVDAPGRGLVGTKGDSPHCPVYRRSGVSDGSAAAILCRAEDAHRYSKHPILLKALSFAAGPAEGYYSQDYDFTTFPEVVASSQDAYQQAGIKNPREKGSMAGGTSACPPPEAVLMEEWGFSPRGQGWKDVLDGRFDGDGPQPVNPDGGLKSFGHPIGASGLRMMYGMGLQVG